MKSRTIPVSRLVTSIRRRPLAFALSTAAVLAATTLTLWAAGTALQISFALPVVTCTTNGGSVSAGYTVTMTAADAALVTETLTLGTTPVASNSYTVLAGNILNGGGWTYAGRLKTRDGTFTTSGLADGIYTLEVCATQNGSTGNPNKHVCQTETILVNCGGAITNSCTSAPFGEVVGNSHIGTNATAQINFQGNFGSAASVTITGPGYSETELIQEDGNSCNYHANWKFTNESGADFTGNGGAGVYRVDVTGNSQPTLTFYVTLTE